MTASRALPVARQSTEAGARCSACAAQATREQMAADERAAAARAVTVRSRPLPTLTQPISRDADRLGPGDQVTHARQRVVLGRWSRARLVLLNGGALLATAGVLSGVGPLILVGTMACLVAVVAALMLLADAAMAASFRSDQPTPAARSGGG